MKILTHTEWFMKYVESLVLSLKSNVDPFRIKDERLHNSSDYGQKGCRSVENARSSAAQLIFEKEKRTAH